MRVAFLGLGIMGSRMAANLVRAGFELNVWNRTRAKAEEFCERHSARLAATPQEAAGESEVVVTMVVDGSQVREILLGPEGAASGAKEGTLFIDCSTIGRQATVEIGEELAAKQLSLVDAPVTGSSPRAEDGTLTIMAGGSQQDFERAQPVLEPMAQLVVHAGELGQGQMVKLINNAVAATNAAVVGQALLVGAKTGVDLDALVEVMAAGSGASTMLDLKARPMREHDYTTLFKLDHMLKDLRLCLQEGQDAGATFPYAALTTEVLAVAAGMGHGDEDFAALIEVLEGAANAKL